MLWGSAHLDVPESFARGIIYFSAFLLIGWIVFLCIDLYNHLIKGKRHMVPIILIGLGVLIFGIGIVWFYIQQANLAATPSQPLSGPASSPTPELPKPKKFYTQRNKSDLADALTDLSEIFNTTGANIEQKTHQIVNRWNIEVSRNIRQHKMPDTADLIGQLSELSNLTVILNRTLYDDNGFVKKNRTYSDELNPILQFPQKGPSSPDSPISILQISINVFRNGISSIELAKKYNDQELISSMAENLEIAFRNYLKGCDAFRQWRDETQKRIDNFRNSQL